MGAGSGAGFLSFTGLAIKNRLVNAGPRMPQSGLYRKAKRGVNGTSVESRWNRSGISKLLILMELTKCLDAFCVRQIPGRIGTFTYLVFSVSLF